MDKRSIKKTKRSKTKVIKILMLVGYSSGPSGVWQRCRDEAVELSNLGYNVFIFSSNAVKGNSKERAFSFDYVNTEIPIRRFPYKKLGGESYMSWDFKKAAIEYNPDIIISHAYRHSHSSKAIKIAKEIGCKCICVTHAPFNCKRGILSSIAVALRDSFSNINKFDKVVAVSKWEIPILKRLGLENHKLIRIPNPILDIYFDEPEENKTENGILFLGRFHPIKDIETLVRGVGDSRLFNRMTLVGLGEQTYVEDIQFIERVKDVKINWYGPVYGIKEKIKIIDDHEIFVLPSRREAMPLALVEAMARGKIVVSSRTDGAKELIKDGENGFLFDIGDSGTLGKILDKIKMMKPSKKEEIKRKAKESVDERRMSKTIKKWEKMLKTIL